MEDSAIIVAVIAAIASVFGAVFTFFSNRYNSKINKTTNILEVQYLKVISPIHQIIHMTPIHDIYNEIYTIIKENYYLLPDQLWDIFVDSKDALKEATNTKDVFRTPFGKQIKKFYKILRYKLGYSTIKVSREDKKSEQLLAKSNFDKFLLDILFYTALSAVALLIIYIIVLLTELI